MEIMSEVNSVSVKKRNNKNIKNLRVSGVVKSLILEYEDVLSYGKCDNNTNIDVKVMGAEQSSVRATANNNNIVKQRISEFSKIATQNDFTKKTTRSVSTYGNLNKKATETKNFQRSKSVDVFKKDKDPYLGSQSLPKNGEKVNSHKNALHNKKTHVESNKSKSRNNLVGKIKVSKADVYAGNINLSKIHNALCQTTEGIGAISRDTNSSTETDRIADHCDNTQKKEEFSENSNAILENKLELHSRTSVEEFEEIENQLKDAEKTINELKENHQPCYISEVRNFILANSNESIKQHFDVTDDFDCLSDVENVDIYVYQQDSTNNCENEFGEVSKDDLVNMDFIEAYNQTGYELIITSINSVKDSNNIPSGDSASKHDGTSIDGGSLDVVDNIAAVRFPDTVNDVAPNNTMEGDGIDNKIPIINSVKDINNISGEDSASNDDGTSIDGDRLDVVNNISAVQSADIVKETAPNNTIAEDGIDNKIYFTKEELNILIPDDEGEPDLSDSGFNDNLHTDEDQNKYYLGINAVADSINENEIRTQPDDIQKDEFENVITSETTIYDRFQNPIIAKVRSITRREEINKDFGIDKDPTVKSTDTKPKIDYIIEEIIETEKNYIDHLNCVLTEYMPYLKTKNTLQQRASKTRYLFGNIKEIYRATQKFYKALKSCSNNYEAVAKTFINFKPLFEMYPWYFKNKPFADQYLLGEFKDIVMVRERELNDQLGLASHLLTPIQRLGKYILFLEQIRKELFRKELTSVYITEAITMIRKQMSTGNDYIAVDSIKKCPIGLLEQGSFLLREKFNVLKPKKYEAVIFLFEKILVFTTTHTKNSELFIYRDSIKLNEMGIVTYDYQPLVFLLKRFPSSIKEPKDHNEYVIEAKTDKVKKIWTEQIEKSLWDQLIKCRERQRELHNHVKKHILDGISDRTKKKKSECK